MTEAIMRASGSAPIAVCLFLSGCRAETSPAPAAQGPSTTPAAVAGSTAATPAPAPQSPGSTASAGVLATGHTIWGDVVAEAIGFRRRGTVLTAEIRLRNVGQNEFAWAAVDFTYGQAAYVIDPAAGKKYQLLRDEHGVAIASEGDAVKNGVKDGFSARLYGGKSLTVWAKFPAPPMDVKVATLQMPGMPTFDLTIQDP